MPTSTSSAISVMEDTRVERSPCKFATPAGAVLGLAPAAYSGRLLRKFTIAKAWEYSLRRLVSKADRSMGMRQLMEGGRVSKIERSDRRRL